MVDGASTTCGGSKTGGRGNSLETGVGDAPGAAKRTRPRGAPSRPRSRWVRSTGAALEGPPVVVIIEGSGVVPCGPPVRCRPGGGESPVLLPIRRVARESESSEWR